MDEILNRILQLLRDRNIAKGKFLKDLGFNKSAIAGWENGDYASYKQKLPEIAAYFGVSLDWLAGNEQKERPAAESDELMKKLQILLKDPEMREIYESLIPLSPAGIEKVRDFVRFQNEQEKK